MLASKWTVGALLAIAILVALALTGNKPHMRSG